MDFDYTRIKMLGEKSSSSLLFNLLLRTCVTASAASAAAVRTGQGGCWRLGLSQRAAHPGPEAWPGGYLISALHTHKVFCH